MPTKRSAPVEPVSKGELNERALASLPGTSVIVFDTQLRILLATGRALLDHGYDTARMEGESLAAVVPTRAYERLAPAYERALSGATETFEYQSADERGWYRVNVGPIRDDAGRVIAGLAISQNISDRRRAEEEAKRSSQLLRDVINSIGTAVSVKDEDGRFLLVNTAYGHLVGRAPEEIEGKRLEEVYPAPLAEQYADDDARALAGEHVDDDREYPRADGSRGMVRITRTPLRRADGSVYGVCAAGQDVTTRRRVEAQLRQATELFETAFRHAPIDIALVGLDGRFLKVNESLCSLTGYPEAELTALAFQDITHPDDLEEDLELADRVLAGKIDHYSLDKRYFTKRGHLIWVRLSGSLVRDETGRPSHFIAQVEDISKRKRMEARLRDLADHDPLTDLLNRRRFHEELERQLSRCIRYGERGALLVFDVDGFKDVNDRYGHQVGDAVLRGVARTLRRRIRGSDIAARIGGDEFAALLLNISGEQALALAEDIRAAIERTPMMPNGGGHVTISGGVEVIDESTAGRDVFATADAALYRAKRHGRNVIRGPRPDPASA